MKGLHLLEFPPSTKGDKLSLVSYTTSFLKMSTPKGKNMLPMTKSFFYSTYPMTREPKNFMAVASLAGVPLHWKIFVKKSYAQFTSSPPCKFFVFLFLVWFLSTNQQTRKFIIFFVYLFIYSFIAVGKNWWQVTIHIYGDTSVK